MSEIRICENCGYHNSIENLECEKCGFDLSFVIPVDENDINENAAKNLSEGAIEETEAVSYTGGSEEIDTSKCDESCGDRYLLSADQITRITIEDGMIIGRDGVTAGQLGTSTFVSRKHAVFSVDNGKVTVTDASTNGTFVNGRRLEKLEPAEIRDGDRIRFADVEFGVHLNANR